MDTIIPQLNETKHKEIWEQIKTQKYKPLRN